MQQLKRLIRLIDTKDKIDNKVLFKGNISYFFVKNSKDIITLKSGKILPKSAYVLNKDKLIPKPLSIIGKEPVVKFVPENYCGMFGKEPIQSLLTGDYIKFNNQGTFSATDKEPRFSRTINSDTDILVKSDIFYIISQLMEQKDMCYIYYNTDLKILNLSVKAVTYHSVI